MSRRSMSLCSLSAWSMVASAVTSGALLLIVLLFELQMNVTMFGWGQNRRDDTLSQCVGAGASLTALLFRLQSSHERAYRAMPTLSHRTLYLKRSSLSLTIDSLILPSLNRFSPLSVPNVSCSFDYPSLSQR